jgi:hypothetical protein
MCWRCLEGVGIKIKKPVAGRERPAAIHFALELLMKNGMGTRGTNPSGEDGIFRKFFTSIANGAALSVVNDIHSETAALADTL